MIQLFIQWYDGFWYADISNSQISYRFAGATSEEGFQNVIMFQQAMAINRQAMIAQVQNIFVDVPVGEEVQAITTMLDASSLSLRGEEIFTVAEEGATLADELIEASEALLLVL